MASLGTLRPGAANTTNLPTTGSIIGNPGGSTALSDDSDATYDGQNTNSSGTYQYGRELANMPTDFGTMATLSVQCRTAWQSTPSNSTWDDVAARVVGSDGTTILAAANSGGTFQSMGNPPETATYGLRPASPQAFSYVNTSANKTAWDGAIIQLQWVRTRSKGGDSLGMRISEAYITGTYTPSATPLVWATDTTLKLGDITRVGTTLYAIAVGTVAGTDYLTAWKSTDGGSSWSEIGYLNRPLFDQAFSGGAVAPDASGNLRIAWPKGGADVGYCVFDTTSEAFGTVEVITFTISAGEVTEVALALDSSDVPHIVGENFDDTDFTDHRLVYADRGGGSWSSETVDGPSSTRFSGVDITIDSSDRPVVSYVHGTSLKAARGPSGSFSVATITTARSADIGNFTSVVISSDDVDVAYTDGSNDLAVVRHASADSWSTWQSPASSGSDGFGPSMATHAGRLYVAYGDGTDTLKREFDGSWTSPSTLINGSLGPHLRWSVFNNASPATYGFDVLAVKTTSPRLNYTMFSVTAAEVSIFVPWIQDD